METKPTLIRADGDGTVLIQAETEQAAFEFAKNYFGDRRVDYRNKNHVEYIDSQSFGSYTLHRYRVSPCYPERSNSGGALMRFRRPIVGEHFALYNNGTLKQRYKTLTGALRTAERMHLKDVLAERHHISTQVCRVHQDGHCTIEWQRQPKQARLVFRCAYCRKTAPYSFGALAPVCCECYMKMEYAR